MKLDQMMREATDDVVVDVVTLTRTARTTGSRIRRRRRVLSASAVVAACACVVAASVTADVTTSDTARDPGPATSSPAPPAPVPAPVDVPLDGRSTAALLEATLLEVADGGVSDVAGQGGASGHGPDTYAELVLAPSDGLGSGVVGVNVQDLSILRGQPRACLSFMANCAVVTLADGTLLRTYRDPSDTSTGVDVRLVAELLDQSRGLRVVVSATNGFDLGGNEWDITRDAPVLDAAQLREVVLDERWGFEVTADVAERGAALAPYDDLDARQGATTPVPS